MQASTVDPQVFVHVRILISLIVGLGLTRLLTGIARLIQHPREQQVYAVHLCWVAWMFLGLAHFWWWEFRLVGLEWTFPYYVFVLGYATTYFLLCVLLFPDRMDDYAGYRAYFMSRRGWFFGLLAATFVLDIGDTWLKGEEHLRGLGIEYPLRAALHFVLCLAAIRTANPRFHAAFVVLAVAYQVSWIMRMFGTMP